MKQHPNKIILMIIVLTMAGLIYRSSLTDTNSYNNSVKYILPSSNISKSDCKFCGKNRPKLLNKYSHENAIILLCLNTWNISPTSLSSDYSINEPIRNSSSIRHDGHGKDQCSWSISSDSLRRTFHATLYYGTESTLNPESLSNIICQSCLAKIWDEVFHNEYNQDKNYFCDVIYDTGNNKFYSISPSSYRIYLGNYWIHVDHNYGNPHQMSDEVYLIYNPSNESDILDSFH